MTTARFFAGAVVLLLAACGAKKDKNENFKPTGAETYRVAVPLTEEQKATLKATIRSMDTAQEAAREAQNPGEGSPTAKQMAEELKKAECKFETNETSLIVTGPTCPIAMRFSLVLEKKPKESHMATSLAYDVKSTSYAELNDVTGIGFNGDVKQVEKDGVTYATIAFGGEVRSRKQGNLSLSVKGAVKGKPDGTGEGTVSWTITFPQFTAELVQTRLGKDTEYTINGERVSDAEFQTYVGKSGSVTGPGGGW